jgi:hypothetical protein
MTRTMEHSRRHGPLDPRYRMRGRQVGVRSEQPLLDLQETTHGKLPDRVALNRVKTS